MIENNHYMELWFSMLFFPKQWARARTTETFHSAHTHTQIHAHTEALSEWTESGDVVIVVDVPTNSMLCTHGLYNYWKSIIIMERNKFHYVNKTIQSTFRNRHWKPEKNTSTSKIKIFNHRHSLAQHLHIWVYIQIHNINIAWRRITRSLGTKTKPNRH